MNLQFHFPSHEWVGSRGKATAGGIALWLIGDAPTRHLVLRLARRLPMPGRYG